MTRRPNELTTSALVLVAAMATACSGSNNKPQKTAAQEPKQSVPMKPPVATDGEGFVDTSKPIATGPVSFEEGESVYKARNYAIATDLFTRYTEQHPKNAWGHFMLGLSAWKSGNLIRAEGGFKQALTIDPKHVKSLVNLSRVLLDENRPEEAVATLMTANEIEPTSTDVARLLGRAYSAQGKTEEAVSAYMRAIELDEKDCWAMNNLGLLFLEQGRAEDALPLLARAVELDKAVPAFHNNLGMALEHTGRFSAAATAYSNALTADPNYEKAKQNLARVEKVKEDPTKEPFVLETTAKGPVDKINEAITDKVDEKVEEKVETGRIEPIVSQQVK